MSPVHCVAFLQSGAVHKLFLHMPVAVHKRLASLPLQAGQPLSKEEALRNMQSYKAGLAQALSKHEDLLKAQRAPAEGGKSGPGVE